MSVLITCLLLFACLVWPLLLFLFRESIPGRPILRFAAWAAIFFALHNVCYYWGFSVKGKDFDNLVFTLEYMVVVAVGMAGLRAVQRLWWLRYISFMIFLVAGIVVPLFSWLGSLISNPERTYRYEQAGTQYEFRYYEYGSAFTSSGFWLYTYRDFKYLPIEQLVDVHNFGEMEASTLPEDAKFYVLGDALYIDGGRQRLQRKL